MPTTLNPSVKKRLVATPSRARTRRGRDGVCRSGCMGGSMKGEEAGHQRLVEVALSWERES